MIYFEYDFRVLKTRFLYKILLIPLRWHKLPVSVITMSDPIIISPTMKCQTAIEIMSKRNVDQLPVVDSDGTISGMLQLTQYLVCCSLMILSRCLNNYLNIIHINYLYNIHFCYAVVL